MVRDKRRREGGQGERKAEKILKGREMRESMRPKEGGERSVK